MIHTAEAKELLRHSMKKNLNSLTPVEYREHSLAISVQLMHWNSLAEKTVILTYQPLNREPNIFPLVEFLRSQQKSVDVLSTGKHEIQHVGNPEIILIPGLAFDKKGFRLGSGQGYFDRFLATLPKETLTVGICFDMQLLPEIPTEEHDVPVQYIVTETQIHKI